MKRPLAITVIGWLFIVVGCVTLVSGFSSHAGSAATRHHPMESALIHAFRVLAIIGGRFLLARRGWARWLIVIWLAFHIVTGALHSVESAVVHAVMLAVFGYFLFRRQGAEFFLRCEQN